MRRKITICLLIVTIFGVKAQKKGIIIPEDERNACFLYAEAESPVNSQVKILIVSSYIYRKKYKDTDASDKLSNASTNYFDGIINPFMEKVEEIISNERIIVSGIAKDIVFDMQKVESFKSTVYAEGSCPIIADEQLNMPQHYSTRSFSKDCRARYIAAKREEGYHVFQVTFDEFYETRNIPYGSLWTEDHYKLVIDQVEKLSPLEIEVYKPGVIKSLPNYKKSTISDYETPSLVVSRSESSDNNSYSKSRSSSSTTTSSSSTSEATIYNNIFLAEAAKKQQEEKAYQDLAKGVIDLFTPSAEESERRSKEYIAKIQYKSSLDKSLEGKIEQAKNGDDQSYYDIYLAYQYSFPKDARYYRKLAYSTGNASIFKEEKRLENNSAKGLFIGIQSGEVSQAGISFIETTNNFGFFMSFRMSVKKTFGDPSREKTDPNNRSTYTDKQGNTYTFISEATKNEQGRYMLSLGSSYHIYKPLFIYAGVGFGTVNTFSYQEKTDIYNKVETVKMDESFIGASTDAGIILKLGRRIAFNGGISLMNLKYPEYVAGVSFNFFPEK